MWFPNKNLSNFRIDSKFENMPIKSGIKIDNKSNKIGNYGFFKFNLLFLMKKKKSSLDHSSLRTGFDYLKLLDIYIFRLELSARHFEGKKNKQNETTTTSYEFLSRSLINFGM